MMDYSVIYIGGGNTFKLLADLKSSGVFQKIKEYLENGEVVFGGSAGAIIFGEDLEACQVEDANMVNLKETSGFNERSLSSFIITLQPELAVMPLLFWQVQIPDTI